jgi:hypothetical protein
MLSVELDLPVELDALGGAALDGPRCSRWSLMLSMGPDALGGARCSWWGLVLSVELDALGGA